MNNIINYFSYKKNMFEKTTAAIFWETFIEVKLYSSE